MSASALPVEGCVSSTGWRHQTTLQCDWVTVSLLLMEETEPHLAHSAHFMILNLSEMNVLNPRAYQKLAVAAVFSVSFDQNHIE